MKHNGPTAAGAEPHVDAIDESANMLTELPVALNPNAARRRDLDEDGRLLRRRPPLQDALEA